ncbi:MAG TPA: uracil-DNA glycosylase family protein [Gammaproteobacteria bacterium]|nr:uracil-DNA glycosylase family protein [Gammaproteobacteria bacterium]
MDMLREMGITVWVPREQAEVEIHEEPVEVAEPVAVAEPVEVPEPVGEPEQPAAPAARDTSSPVAEMDWHALQYTVAQCEQCKLHRTRTQTVFGVGNRQADWMVIGEAPGQEEDRQGEPFVGPAGKLLNEMLKATGRAREDVYIANVVKCRPPKNRDPHPDEEASCGPYLARQIELIQPKVILAIGKVAANRLLGTDSSLGRLRGKAHRHPQFDIPVVVTYHPAYLLRTPADKAKAWADLKLAMSL